MRRPFFFIFAVLIAPLVAAGHPLLQEALWVKFDPDRVHLAVDVSVREIAIAQKIPVGAVIDGISDELSQAAEKNAGYVLDHLEAETDGHPLRGRLTRITPPEKTGFAEQTRYQYELEYSLDPSRPPASLHLTQRMLREFSYAPGEAWIVTYQVRYQSHGTAGLETALLLPGQTLELATGLSAEQPERTSALRRGFRTFGEYFQHGVMHILTGYDHLLFVSALVLAAMSFWEMVKVIAAFTLAHTLTLTLSVFHILRLPSLVVEPVISASIVFVAVENIFWPGRAKSRVRLAVAFGFGLVHGLGFAGGLLDAMQGLPGLSLGLALLAFSLGVEVGHQLVVLPLFGLLRWGQAEWPHGFRTPVMRYGSICISLAGVYYLIDALRTTAGA